MDSGTIQITYIRLFNTAFYLPDLDHGYDFDYGF